MNLCKGAFVQLCLSSLALSLLACAHGGASGGGSSGGGLTVAGPHCSGGTCRCREEGAGAGEVPAGHKRFELRVESGTDPIEISIDGRGTLKKPPEANAAACAYVDLPPGRHRVLVRAAAADPVRGMIPIASVSEWGSEAKSWYETLRFQCGLADPCTKDDMRDWFDKMKAIPRGITDPCGSVRIRDLKWGTERSPEARLDDVQVDVVLDVRAFTPDKPHGASDCGRKGGME